MAWNRAPLYPGKPLPSPQGSVNSGSSTDLELVSGHATYGAMIEGPILCHLISGVSRTFNISIKNSSTITAIGRVTTGSVANTILNIFQSQYIPGLDDDNPRLILGPGEKLIIDPGSDTGASQMDFTALNVATFEYQA